MQALAGVFFEVNPGDADLLLASFGRDFDEAEFGQWLVVLRDLVSLWEIGIEVVLTGKDRGLVEAAVQGHGGQRGELDDFLVQYWERAGHSQANGANIGVWRGAKFRRARAEDLGCRQ